MCFRWKWEENHDHDWWRARNWYPSLSPNADQRSKVHRSYRRWTRKRESLKMSNAVQFLIILHFSVFSPSKRSPPRINCSTPSNSKIIHPSHLPTWEECLVSMNMTFYSLSAAMPITLHFNLTLKVGNFSSTPPMESIWSKLWQMLKANSYGEYCPTIFAIVQWIQIHSLRNS